MAGEFTCLSGDRLGDGAESEDWQVYVWGSNSSHQLGEGTEEKILVPKLTRAFGHVDQVSTFKRTLFSVI